jgi:hypothetical protein
MGKRPEEKMSTKPERESENGLMRGIRIMILRGCLLAMHEVLPGLIAKFMTRRELLTYEETRLRLKISKPIFFKILRDKRLPTVVLEERTYRIDSIELDAFIEASKEFRDFEIEND